MSKQLIMALCFSVCTISAVCLEATGSSGGFLWLGAIICFIGVID